MQDPSRRPRRRRTAVVKAEILDACAQPGASLAGVARAHGVNANLDHRWRREAKGLVGSQAARRKLAEFIPLTTAAAPTVASAEEIRIELRRGGCTVSVAWPTSSPAECLA